MTTYEDIVFSYNEQALTSKQWDTIPDRQRVEYVVAYMLTQQEKNAERYLWLRDKTLVDGEIYGEIYVAVDSPEYPGRWALVGEWLDMAIDGKIKKEG